MSDRLTKFNEETGRYEFHEVAKTQEEFNAQRKAVIQRLGEFEDKSTDVAEEIFAETHNMLVKVMRAVDDGLTKAILTDNEQAKLVHAGTKETLRCVILALAELKKKYIGKDTNVTTNTEEGK